ncbi:MAG TPA: YndJ family protein [Bacillaceae bacterium]
MTFRKAMLLPVSLFIAAGAFSEARWPYIMLLAAQLLYVPLALKIVVKKSDWFARIYPYIAYPAFCSVALLQIAPMSAAGPVLAGIYFFFCLATALYGFSRFLKRGFAFLEEWSINSGLMYLALGGAWFFAHEAELETGFPPLINWLTAIHFHYSAFLLPIFTGLLGRIVKGTLFKWVCTVILISPMAVALGITFSRWMELISVLLYIMGIYGLIYLSFKASFIHRLQRWMVRLSFGALGITILFSLLYAFGRLNGQHYATIDFMLLFHGVLNCVLFAAVGLIGWCMSTPKERLDLWKFPVSTLRGGNSVGEAFLGGKRSNRTCKGLVDRMEEYEPDIDCHTLSPMIVDFYENTGSYRLFAAVHWRTWFKPFAAVYRLASRRIQQINLPLSGKTVEMTGGIYAIEENLDGRSKPRAWLRKINRETCFVAVYSSHRSRGRTYMNIALPLPFSSMIGILRLSQMGNGLQLSSSDADNDTDSGIYLAFGTYIFKLPLKEVFFVQETKQGMLMASHNMWIFSIPFLTIEYQILHQNRIN